jgi:hypothetical protein
VTFAHSKTTPALGIRRPPVRVAGDDCALHHETVEHPFGMMKARVGVTHFLTETLPKVAAEMAHSVLNILGPSTEGSFRRRSLGSRIRLEIAWSSTE